MKTAEEMAKSLVDKINDNYHYLYRFSDFLDFMKEFEKEIREDKTETRIKELTSMGEFKTVGEAMEYCRLHGLSIRAVDGNLFQIAGALMDARKDQDKITQRACAENVFEQTAFEDDQTQFDHGVRASHSAIMNTKAV